jgi:hypothetical protein
LKVIDLAPCHKPWPKRQSRVHRLALHPVLTKCVRAFGLAVRELEVPEADVIHDGVSSHMLHCVLASEVPPFFVYQDRELDLPVHILWDLGNQYRLAVCYQAATELCKVRLLRWSQALHLSTCSVVDSCKQYFIRPGRKRKEAYFLELDSLSSCPALSSRASSIPPERSCSTLLTRSNASSRATSCTFPCMKTPTLTSWHVL